MRLEIVAYKDNGWYRGFIKGNGVAFVHSSITPIDKEILKNNSSFFIPLKRYVDLYIARESFLNELGKRRFIDKVRKFIGFDYIWVDDTTSISDWRM